jgi:dGTPase
VVAIADEIAQCTHDLEDGVRAQVIRIDDILDNELIQNVIDESNIDTTRLHCALDVRMSIVKNLVGKLIRNVYNESSDNLINYNDRRKKEEKDLPEFKNLSDVYDEKLIGFSKDMGEKVEALSALITNCVVKSQLISQSDAKAEYMITQLFKAYYKHPKQLPDYILKRYCRKSGRSFSRSLLDDTLLQQDQTFIRMICDHIACMTDQYAEREYKKLYLPDYI